MNAAIEHPSFKHPSSHDRPSNHTQSAGAATAMMSRSAWDTRLAGKSETTEIAFAPFFTNAGTVQVGNKIGLLLNCGAHASRVVGKGGSKIRDLMDRSGAGLRVARNSGLCEIRGTFKDVQVAKRLVLDVVDDGVVRDMRATISQALSIPEDARDGYLMTASHHDTKLKLAWHTPVGVEVPFLPPDKSYTVPLSLQ